MIWMVEVVTLNPPQLRWAEHHVMGHWWQSRFMGEGAWCGAVDNMGIKPRSVK